MSWFSGARARLHLLFARRAAESRIDDEVAFHIEMETDRLVREQRLSPDEARRRALATFGGVTRHTEELRDGRGLAWLGGLSLDMKLGFRMLVKYPGLTIVGGLAMAFAIWAAAVTFEVVGLIVNPTLPLPGGDRIVQLRNWDVEANRAEPRALYDFIVWREALSSVTDLGAYEDETRNLIGSDGDVRRVQIAAITASAFRIASGTPLLGRALVATDEEPGAPPVIVLGYDVWRTRFASDPGVIGRTVQLGDSYATVVGVMREGFAFPVAHELWMPLRPSVLDRAPRAGPALTVFGRLAPGASLAAAQAELATIGKRAATAFPETHRHLQPQVASYARMFWEPSAFDRGLIVSFNLFAVLLLVLLCSNVALLFFARAATRETELIVRSALGASRNRIIAQLVVEALVLGGGAAVGGLAAAALVLQRWARPFLERNMGTLPFWYDPHLSVTTVLYAVGLTILGAVIAGVVPALKVTKGLGSRLKEGTAGGGGLRFGGIWTAVIVAQVALTLVFPAVVIIEQRELRRIQSFDVGFRAGEYLGVQIEMDTSTVTRGDTTADRIRFAAAIDALRQRVAAEPGVSGVTFVDRLPRDYHRERDIELDDSSGPTPPSAVPPLREVALASIDPSYFDVLRAPILAGRGFQAGDIAAGARAVIVDQGFVDQVLLGRNAIGRRVRLAEEQRDGESHVATRPWYEIVGVVKDLGMASVARRRRVAGLYFPAAPASAGSVNMIVHVQGDPLSLAPRVRAIANATDVRLSLSEFQRLDQVTDSILWVLGLWLRITAVLTAVALLLSLAGIYAVMSFTVARRTREIGVRVALGASRRRVVAAIFRRPLTQVGSGVAVGGILVAAMAVKVSDGGLSAGQAALLVAYAAFMLAVCLLACVVPTRRALRVEPTEALRAE
jgi:predicted permease